MSFVDDDQRGEYMLIDTKNGKILVNEIAYRIIGEKAPRELPSYVTIRDQYFADPESFIHTNFLDTVEAEDEELASGAADVIMLLTKAVFPIVTPILSYVLDAVADALKEEGAKQASDYLRSLFKDKTPKPIFTQAQLEVIASTIQDIAKTEADRLGLEQSQAQTVSDSVIARLALAKK
ncbi:hypothetical protein I4641_13925 [Waterburya agarophytonicola K14]|uniref:Uncharacterized protein n=1 Tax=Waterburya agarophytonicola KI4 TaxID=2874699 RepID=A0A964FI20_9CYAN|nr:hypothetical protein [Waterburya agarophytonicola]MCC0178079.1 hypothetical protein [Waterburya agarophytonicola KI4]